MRQNYVVVGILAVASSFAWVGCGSDNTTGPSASTPAPKPWQRAAGGSLDDFGTAVAVDGSGNVIVAGQFQGSATFGTTTLTSAGLNDIFVAKYDAGGTLLWAHSAGSSGNDTGSGVAVDESGNVVVTGYFVGDATFGTTTLTSAGLSDVFVAKYDVGGTFQWAHSAGGAGSDFGYGVAAAGSGSVVVTGAFQGTAAFAPPTLTSAGAYDVFVAKYDGGGTLLWAQSAGGTDTDQGFGVAVDGSGDAVLTGYFAGDATFGATTLTSAGSDDVFIARYDAGGTLVRAQSAGGSGADLAYAVAVDRSGNVVVTGTFGGSATFGGTTLTSVGASDVFVARYDAAGTLLWAHSAGGTGNVAGYGVAADGSGNVMVTGSLEGSAMFSGKTVTSAGGRDVFVAKYSAGATLLWAQAAGGSGNDVGLGVAVGSSGQLAVTGYFVGDAAFGGKTLSSAGGNDVFIVRMSSNGF
jgi:hypothetical protein